MSDSHPFYRDYNLYPSFAKPPRLAREAENEAGTSAGAQKGWETRKGGGGGGRKLTPKDPEYGMPKSARDETRADIRRLPPRAGEKRRAGRSPAGAPQTRTQKELRHPLNRDEGVRPGLSEARTAPGPRVYTKRGHRLRIEAEGGEYRLVDSQGKVHRTGDRTTLEHHIGEQLRRGVYRAR